jgi:hypothetical protein
MAGDWWTVETRRSPGSSRLLLVALAVAVQAVGDLGESGQIGLGIAVCGSAFLVGLVSVAPPLQPGLLVLRGVHRHRPIFPPGCDVFQTQTEPVGVGREACLISLVMGTVVKPCKVVVQ